MRMKARVTLTVDPRVSHEAKRAAQARGLSLSALVETLLREITGNPAPGDRPTAAFSLRWQGRLSPSRRDDPRARRLRSKYGA